MGSTAGRGNGKFWVALTLLAVGIAFLVRQPPTFAFQPDRWWALLMVVPAAALLRNGRPRGGRALAVGAVVGVAVAFLLTPDIGASWPLITITMGIAALLS